MTKVSSKQEESPKKYRIRKAVKVESHITSISAALSSPVFVNSSPRNDLCGGGGGAGAERGIISRTVADNGAYVANVKRFLVELEENEAK